MSDALVAVDTAAAERWLTQVALRQLPFATMSALNTVAFTVMKKDLKDEMRRVFDEPTRWSLNAFGVEKATKRTLEAKVVQKSPRKWLDPQVHGGKRKYKAFENLLSTVGVLPYGKYFVPGDDAQLDKFGNMRGKDITAMLSDLKAHRESGSTANVTEASRKRNKRSRYFLIGRDNPVGIGQRTGKTFSVIGAFVEQPSYDAVLDLDEVGEKTAGRVFEGAFNSALERAIATAR